MKITIKIDKNKKAMNQEGHPIILYITGNYSEKKVRTPYRTHLEHWDLKLATPKKKHPKYHFLLDYIIELKAKIGKLELESTKRNIHISEVPELLFRKNSEIFNELAKVKEGSTQQSALRSFDRFHPDIRMTAITKKMVLEYRDTLLKTNKAAGVDSYLRSLRAIWNAISNEENPFKGVKVMIPPKTNIVATDEDLRILKYAPLQGMPNNYRNYWLLMFYLGGIDPEALAKLKYENIVNGRINFNRNKGQSKQFCSNLIPVDAMEIIKSYDCAPYLTPIHKYRYDTFRRNFTRRFKILCSNLGLSVELRPKSARYTFIDRAQQLLIDERIVAEIVGHKRNTVTSLYTNDFPYSVRDQAQLKVIRF